MQRQKESQVNNLLKQDKRERTVAQTKVVAVEVVGTDQIQDLLKECVEGVRQKRGGLDLSNWKDRGAINQDEKCSEGVDLGEKIRNSLLLVLSLRCLLDKQLEMSSRLLHIRELGREGPKEKWIEAGGGVKARLSSTIKSQERVIQEL